MSDLELLERRVPALEQEVEGEKLVTRHILEQTRRNADDLAAITSRLNRHDERFDRLEVRVQRVEDNLNALRRDLPSIVAGALRDVLKDEKR